MFHRLHTDQTQTPAPLENLFAGPIPSACWLLGGGPSLAQLPCEEIARSPIPKMALNLAGTRLVRPTFWTSYDPSARFHRSIYLDPGITKFVHRRRAMDLIPETTFKVCEAPNTCFFDRDANRGFADFLAPHHHAIVDWADSLVQAIDILYRLGFRILYLAGCEMRIQPSPAQQQTAEAHGIQYPPNGRLDEWLNACHKAGLGNAEFDDLDPAPQYHFDEHKPIAAAANTDLHYFRVSQYLRLSRRSLATAGMQLISATPGSRLNDYFPYLPVERILDQVHAAIGNPQSEPVRGLYRQTNDRQPENLGPMRDYRPHHWPNRKPIPAAARPAPAASSTAGGPTATSPSPTMLVEKEGLGPVEPAVVDNPANRLLARLDQLPDNIPAPNEQP